MRWEITGADATTGREITMNVGAASREESERSANYHGVLVTAVRKFGARQSAAGGPVRPVADRD
jgi:hypothetical protein